MIPLSSQDKYQPRYDGVRPSWGWFVRHAADVTFDGCSLALAKGDGKYLTLPCEILTLPCKYLILPL